jgi:regulation of enolase protein 1 (concanavalin A-like superfamily)
MSAAPVHPTLPFSGLTVVDEIDCSQTPVANQFYEEGPGSVSQIQTILGSPARVLPNPAGSVYKYFAYRIGQGKGLQPGKAYVLEVEYPEDQSRAMVIMNGGEAGARGLYTGRCVGDALHPPNVNNNPESLEIPVAGAWKTWRSLFHLHDRFSAVQRPKGDALRPLVPADGFYVVVVHLWNKDEPLSAGAAVRKIRLLEAPTLATYDAGLRQPPAGLPRRHLFSREEMYDGIAGLGFSAPENRGVTNSVNYFEYRARLMKFLGVNTFTKDLLEFGGTQGWDSGPGGGNAWYYTAAEPGLWDSILTMLGGYGLDVMPYYEYAGSKGSNSLGIQKLAKPLNANLQTYTQITWAESCRADLSLAATHDDAKKLLDVTMTRYRDKVNFIGAWFRGRVSQMPLSFSDANIAQFSQEMLGGRPLSRAQLQSTTSIYNQYIQWFFGKREGFVEDMKNYLRAQGVNKDAVVLYTSDASEPGKSYGGTSADLITENATNAAAWTAAGVTNSALLTQANSESWHWKALTTPRGTYSGWEWQHADPQNDPANYAANNGAMLTYTFNKAYTLGNSAWLDAFRTQSGLAMVRHFSLNENVLSSPTGYSPVITDPLGYFVTDFERTGPFCVMAEVLALAKGDPDYIGYLSATTVNRGFPEYVRAFNQAFMALPAVPSIIRSGASSNGNVVVRDYATDGFGTYLAVVNTATSDQNGVIVTLPYQADITDATTGIVLATSATTISFDLYPFQVKALLLKKHTATGPQAVDDTVTMAEGGFVDVNVVSNDTGPGTKTVVGYGTASHGSITIVSNQVRYTPVVGYYGSDSFSYTISNGSDTDSARVNVTVTNTQVAANLTSWGIQDQDIGAEDTGHSRLLLGGVIGEVVGFGPGTVGVTDAGHLVSRFVTGDFQATVKVNSVSGTSDAMGGLMVRQSAQGGARMVAALVGTTGNINLLSRSVANAEVAGKASTNSGAVWLRLTRAGDLVTVSKASVQAGPYTEVAWNNLPGLPATLQIGLWASGGDRYSGSRTLTESFSVANTTTGALFQQDFSSSTNYTSYIGATANLFNDLSYEATGGPWSIDAEGALAVGASTSTASNNDSGFTRTTALTPLASVLKISLRVGINGIVNNYSDVGFLDFGTFSTVSDYGSGSSASTMFAQVGLRGGGDGDFRFKLDGSGTFYGSFAADGSLHRMVVYLSQSASDQTYTGPDGLSYTLQAGKASLWMNDQVVKENWTRDATYTAASPGCFKFRSPGAAGVTFRFDDLMIEARFGATTPTHSNTTPVAGTDSAVTSEGQPVTIDVLANDTDSDAGPQGLQITNASAPNGTAAVVAGKIVYTPAPGFYGNTSLTYTISDGLAVANGTANVTVNSTSTASNLTSAGLTGLAIGSGSAGGSRILSDGYWEVQQTGGAGTATSDKLWWERKSVTGDFQVEARIREFQSYGTGGAGGLMIREGTATGARLVQISLDSTTVAKALHRLTVNGSLAQGATTGTVIYPAAWLQLERSGASITARVSGDGMNFTTLETVQLSGLTTTVEAGLWATNGRIAATGFIVRPYQAEILKMDFNSSTNYLSNVQELDPEPNQVSDISAESLGGTWSIDTGRLKIVRTADTSADCGAGLVRTTPFPGTPTALRVTFDLTLANVTTTNVDLFFLELGNFTSITDYNSSIVSAPIHDRLSIRSRGAGKYCFRNNGLNSADYTTAATPTTVTYWVNNGTAAISYRDPAGTLQTLDPQKISVWMGGSAGTPIFTNVAKDANMPSTSISMFRFRMTGPNYTAWFDNLVVDDDFNQPPVANNDGVSTNEGVSLSGASAINVLANDTDADNGPQPLVVQSVVSPTANGGTVTVNIASNKVEYVPAVGFYGTDIINYTISDSVATASAQVVVTVNNTALAQDLTSKGLTGSNIGSGSSGSSRILADSTWEVRGVGTGLGGTADIYHGEMAALTGNFEMVTRVDSLQVGTGGRVGLAVREGTGTGDRMLAISIDAAGTVRYSSRTTTGATVTETAASGTWTLPGTWLMLKRQGIDLVAAVSSDGVNYQPLVTQPFTGLITSLQAGLWVSGGAGSYNGRAVVEGFGVDPLLFNQNYDRSGAVLTDYSSTTPDGSQVNEIKAEDAGSTWSLNSGWLKMTRLGTSGEGSGMTRLSGSSTPNVMECSFKVKVSCNTSSELAILDLGNFTTLSDYNNTSVSAGVANRLSIKGGGNGLVKFYFNTTTYTGTYAADGTTELKVSWILNQQPVGSPDQSYRGPDGNLHTLATGYSDLWVNGSLVLPGVVRTSGLSGSNFSGLRFRSVLNAAFSISFDEFRLAGALPQ